MVFSSVTLDYKPICTAILELVLMVTHVCLVKWKCIAGMTL